MFSSRSHRLGLSIAVLALRDCTPWCWPSIQSASHADVLCLGVGANVLGETQGSFRLEIVSGNHAVSLSQCKVHSRYSVTLLSK